MNDLSTNETQFFIARCVRVARAVARCLSVGLSVTRRHCLETAKRIIKHFPPSSIDTSS